MKIAIAILRPKDSSSENKKKNTWIDVNTFKYSKLAMAVIKVS